MRRRIRPRMMPIGARCALRHDQKFVSRTPASVGLQHFHFPQRAGGRARGDRSAIDRHERAAGSRRASLLQLELLPEHNLDPPPGALRRERSGVSASHGAAKRRFDGAGTAPASFFPARAVSSAFLLPVLGARELGFHRSRR
jgi:hypothetical protein